MANELEIQKTIQESRKMIEDIDTRLYDGPIEADRWKNLYFTKEGKSFIGLECHLDEKVAKQKADTAISNGLNKVIPPITDCTIVCLNGKFGIIKEYSHNMQIPWNKP